MRRYGNLNESLDLMYRICGKGMLNETQVSSEYDGMKFYHTAIDRKGIGYLNLCRKIGQEGLVCNNNGETNGIWFAPTHEYNAYGKRLEFEMEYNAENKEKYELYTDGGTMWAHKNIPFSDLKIISSPVLASKDHNELWSNIDLERWSKRYTIERTIDALSKNPEQYVFFTDALELTMGKEYTDRVVNGVADLENFSLDTLFS